MCPRLAGFPKCYIDRIAGDRSMSVFDWIAMARDLDADGPEELIDLAAEAQEQLWGTPDWVRIISPSLATIQRRLPG